MGAIMRRIVLVNLVLASVVAASSAHADFVLLANGTLTGSSAGANADLSGLAGTLENGLAANILGGMGSGLAYAGGNTFIAVPDRGPNATSYNPAVDDTVSYISRFQTVSMSLTANPAGSPLAFSLTPTLAGTTLLSSPTPLNYGTGAGLGVSSGAPSQNTTSQYFFTGRSDNYGVGNSGNAANARFDPEGVRVSPDGKSVFISDEYGPYVRQFDRATGQLVKTFTLAANLDVSNLSPNGATEISGNISGRVANKGMEGLAITPDGKTLVGIVQAPLIQDAASNSTARMVRIVTIDVATGVTRQYGYNLTNGTGVSEIVAINDHQFLVDERDGKGLGDGTAARIKQFFRIDLTGATDITNLTGASAAAAVVSKTLSVDLVNILNANGITAANIPAKIEGLAFGQDVTVNGVLEHTLWVANDNDFVPNVAGPSQFYVIGFVDSDLPGYLNEQVAGIPESSTWAMMVLGFAGIGLLACRRRSSGNALPTATDVLSN